MDKPLREGSGTRFQNRRAAQERPPHGYALESLHNRKARGSAILAAARGRRGSDGRRWRPHLTRPSVVRTSLFLANALVLGVAVVLSYRAGAPARHFGEGGFTTWVSGAQLLATSYANWKIWRSRAGQFGRRGRHEPIVLWALMAAGFLFLTVDELVQIHEQLDQWIHGLFGITETAVTDRLDDLLVAGYAAAGLGVLFRYRLELRLLRGDLALIILGFVLLFAMIAMDMLFRSEWASAIEEGLKLFSQAAFLAAFYDTYLRTRAAQV